MKCSTKEAEYQTLPWSGNLVKNLSLTQLEQALLQAEQEATVYCYIIASVENKNGHLRQRGSGPNFQGGMITLCTCKHYMRTFLDVENWKGKWIAGFSSIKAGDGRNALIYLMKVGHAFESHYDLWFSREIPDDTKLAKLASQNKFGDVFQPVKPGDPFDSQIYKSPHPEHSHVHNGKWHKDIVYSRNNRSAALLAGDLQNSFLWDKPMLFNPTQLQRGQKKSTLGLFLQQLEIGALL